jgi:hypothetical protein
MMNLSVRCRSTLLVAVAGCVIAGCSGGTGVKTIPASGSVTYKGQPVASGTVTFSPVDAKATAATSAPISKGRYQTAKGLGLTAGDYKVVVTAYKDTGVLNETKDKSAPSKSSEDNFAVPKKYTSYKTTDLELKVSPKESSVSKNFELKD